MVKKYHQTRADREREARGMRKAMDKRSDRKYHQTAEDRRHEAEGMKRAMRHKDEEHSRRKYHQTAEDRAHEAAGMRRAMRERGEGMDDRYFDMIHEDHEEVANLPQHVVQKEFKKVHFLDAYELDDTIHGIDDTRADEVRKMERYHSDTKY